MAVRQIRFVRARESNFSPVCTVIQNLINIFCAPESATIVSQPQQHVLAAGPAVNDTAIITLTCLAEGWPLPAFQWYYNKKKIPGNIISLGIRIFNRFIDI